MRCFNRRRKSLHTKYNGVFAIIVWIAIFLLNNVIGIDFKPLRGFMLIGFSPNPYFNGISLIIMN